VLNARKGNLVSSVSYNNLSFPVVEIKERNLTLVLLLVAKSATFAVPIQFPTILILKQSIGK
jgi:hypothetical protein